eukprot:Selendium_serpulae@DN5956_c1_g1_i1.p1
MEELTIGRTARGVGAPTRITVEWRAVASSSLANALKRQLFPSRQGRRSPLGGWRPGHEYSHTPRRARRALSGRNRLVVIYLSRRNRNGHVNENIKRTADCKPSCRDLQMFLAARLWTGPRRSMCFLEMGLSGVFKEGSCDVDSFDDGFVFGDEGAAGGGE